MLRKLAGLCAFRSVDYKLYQFMCCSWFEMSDSSTFLKSWAFPFLSDLYNIVLCICNVWLLGRVLLNDWLSDWFYFNVVVFIESAWLTRLCRCAIIRGTTQLLADRWPVRLWAAVVLEPSQTCRWRAAARPTSTRERVRSPATVLRGQSVSSFSDADVFTKGAFCK